MIRVLRRHLLSIACLAAAALIGVAAIADHLHKQARMNRAELAEWYCRNEGTRCGGPSSEKIERRWNERQWGYEVAVTALGAFALVRLGHRRARP